MKIGKFAEMHNVTQDTIRHYLELGLLVAEKKGGHFHFGDSDSSDMKKIIELKNLGFSLIEVQKILAMQRISGEKSNTFSKLFLSYLEKRKKETEKIVLHFSNINNSLKEKINEIKQNENNNTLKLGFSLSSLHLLQCPECHNQLTLSEGIIERNYVIEALINCSCGFTAEITDGIYVDKRQMRTKLVDGKRILTKEEYLASSSTQYNNFLYKGMTFLIEQINKLKEQPKYIVELDNCVGFFLMQYIKYLPTDSTYVLIDYDFERLINLKRDLENYYMHKNFIFLCCDYESLPLINSFSDIVIDYQMVRTYEESTGKKLYDVILPFLKTNGNIYGVCSYCEGQDTRNQAASFYNKDKILKLIHNYNLNLIDMTNIGPFREETVNDREANKKQFFQVTYVCSKT